MRSAWKCRLAGGEKLLGDARQALAARLDNLEQAMKREVSQRQEVGTSHFGGMRC